MNSNTCPFIVMYTKDNSIKYSVYDDGKIYGKEQGKLLGKLTSNAIKEIKDILNENMYMFKRLVYYNERLNPFIIRIRDDSRKHRPIKVVGWSQAPRVYRVICNATNWEYVSNGSCM